MRTQMKITAMYANTNEETVLYANTNEETVMYANTAQDKVHVRRINSWTH